MKLLGVSGSVLAPRRCCGVRPPLGWHRFGCRPAGAGQQLAWAAGQRGWRGRWGGRLPHRPRRGELGWASGPQPPGTPLTRADGQKGVRGKKKRLLVQSIYLVKKSGRNCPNFESVQNGCFLFGWKKRSIEIQPHILIAGWKGCSISIDLQVIKWKETVFLFGFCMFFFKGYTTAINHL